jgi:hypothetical protein
LVTFFPCVTQAQQLTFDVFHGNHKIGIITTNRILNQGKEVYDVQSEVNFKVLWKNYQRISSMEVVFKNGTLEKSISETLQNDELEIYSTIHKNGATYRGMVHEQDSIVLESPVNHTAVQMYYQEPVNQEQVFLESFLQYVKLEKAGPGKYQIKMPNGRLNTYIYSEGKLQELQVESTWFTVYFRRQTS